MAFESEVKDYETVRDQLKAVLASNPDFVNQLIRAIRSYNTVVKPLKEKVYNESKAALGAQPEPHRGCRVPPPELDGCASHTRQRDHPELGNRQRGSCPALRGAG